MKKRLLFVDDEVNVLQGLRRTLRSMRDEWEMVFAESGEEALALLNERPFDVVVSDMRMPSMDGATLLEKIKMKFPGIIRIILSGYAADETLLKAMGLSHQYISKPCDPETLKLALARAGARQELLGNEKMKALIGGVETLPSISSVYTELLEKLRSPDVSMGDVGATISRDMGMATKILQLVNSAMFGISRQVADPGDAAKILGLETIRAMVMSVQVFSLFDTKLVPGFSLSGLWRHSLAMGTFAAEISRDRACDGWSVGSALMGGLLHDTGKLVLATRAPEVFAASITFAREQQCSVCEAEVETFGSTHADIGAYLLGLWGLPDAVVEAVGFHHQPAESASKGLHPAVVLHVANAFEHRFSADEQDAPSAPLDDAYLAQSGLAAHLEEWEARCRALAEKPA